LARAGFFISVATLSLTPKEGEMGTLIVATSQPARAVQLLSLIRDGGAGVLEFYTLSVMFIKSQDASLPLMVKLK